MRFIHVRLILFALLIVSGTLIIPIKTLADVQATLYASPSGSGTTCSLSSPCSLTAARDKVRTLNGNMTGDIVVYLRGGTYNLTMPFELTYIDSGTNGYNVSYRAYNEEEPVLSGGQNIIGWSLYDSTKNIYRAYVGTTLQTRQLYVNGVRAIRARGELDPSGFVKTSTGYTAPSSGTYSNISSWGNISDIEVVNYTVWKSYRCGISAISGSAITMKNPCWNNSQLHTAAPMGLPHWFENAYELLDEEGEWYLNRSTGYVYYKPRANENMATATVIIPTLQTLVNGIGTLDNPIHNIHFFRLTFSYATWLGPSGNDGYAVVQAGFHLTGNQTTFQVDNLTKTPANVNFFAAKSIRFERNTFTHLGGVGLGFESGSQNNMIIGNHFHDISSSAVQIGETDDWNPTDTRKIVRNNTVQSNYIVRAAVEYQDAVGVYVGYTDGTLVTHNDISDLPYSGVSVGWGWGSHDSSGTVARNNQITYNHIYNYMNVLHDGGGIYTLSDQPDSLISNNYIHHQSGGIGGIYLDNGTQHYTVNNNVVSNMYSQWLYLQTWSANASNNTVQYNYSDTSNQNIAPSNTVNNNTVIANEIWPAEAAAIMNNSGVEWYYSDSAAPKDDVMILKVINANSTDPSKYVIKKFSNVAYTFQAGDYIQYDVKLSDNIDGAGGIEIYNTDASYFRDTAGWVDQNGISGHPEADISTFGYNKWFHRILAVPSSLVGKTSSHWDLVGHNGISSLTYNVVYDNIVVTDSNGNIQTGGVIYRKAADYNTTGDVLANNITSSSIANANYSLALNKPATAYFMDGSTATMWYPASYAVDGNMATYAQANGQYRWQQQVDLGATYSVDRVKVTMPSNFYATQFDIAVSTDGTEFTTVKSVTGFSGGLSDESFTKVNARYVRIIANKPDGSGQTGAQMAISEIEVYPAGKNLALHKPTAAYFMDGTVATMWYPASYAVDGNPASYAQANGQYRWQEQVDLGATFNVERVKVTMPDNLYATQFNIAVSTDGTNFTMVKSVTGFSGGSSFQTFAAIDARYVKIIAVKPDGSGQAGGQMAISELEVYGQ